MLANNTNRLFKEYREKGIPASKVPAQLYIINLQSNGCTGTNVSKNLLMLFDYKLEPKKDSFNGFVCDECGEMTVEEYVVIKVASTFVLIVLLNNNCSLINWKKNGAARCRPLNKQRINYA